MIWRLMGILKRLGRLASSFLKAFGKKIIQWGQNVLLFMLNTIDTFLNIISSGITEIIKVGKYYVKRMTVYIKNRQTNNYHQIYKEEYVNQYDIPREILEELKQKEKAKVASVNTV